MKYIIVGFNSSGKKKVVDDLRSLGIKVGKIFRSVEEIPDNVYSLSEVYYSREDINNIFENKSYIFIKENKYNKDSFFEGLSFYEYDNNDVFYITPEQFNLIPKFNKDVVFIWLDNNNEQRRMRFLSEKRKYNFQKQEVIEKQDIHDFVNRIYDNKCLYFNNENPTRISAVIYSLIKHPDLFDVYKNRYND